MWHRQHWVLVFWIVACGGDDDVSLDGGLDAGEMGTDAASDSGLDANVTLDSAIDADTCDDDGDGRPSIACGGDDCDDTNANRRPGVAETCDGVDDDCDARVDEGATETFHRDVDELAWSASVGATGGSSFVLRRRAGEATLDVDGSRTAARATTADARALAIVTVRHRDGAGEYEFGTATIERVSLCYATTSPPVD